MSFKRFSSIENSYNNKYVTKALSMWPELRDDIFIIEEKLDGANIQIYIEPDKEYRVGKRSSFLHKDASFNNIWETLIPHQQTIDKLQALSNETGDIYRLFGEIVGPAINKRINYGPKNSIIFFDLKMNDIFLTPENFHYMMRNLGETSIVPILGIVQGLNLALATNVDFDSKVLNVPNNGSEGVVIKPYSLSYFLGEDGRFVIKKKSEKFREKEKVAHKETVPPSDEIASLMLEYKSYINENRMLSVFSKEGPIQDMKDFGKYIVLIQQDAKEDFLKDKDISEQFSEKEVKLIFNVGGLIANLLKGYLKDNK